jgi:hypothetical protein
MEQLQQRQQLQLDQDQQSAHAAAEGVAPIATGAAGEAPTVLWDEDTLDLTAVQFRGLLATVPGLSPNIIAQLGVIRKATRNRMNAQRCRERDRQSKSPLSNELIHPAQERYARRIKALKTSNTALRSSLHLSGAELAVAQGALTTVAL